MAKRRTIRRQRDKALKELAEYKRMAEVRRIGNAMMSQRYYEQVAQLYGSCVYHDEDVTCGFLEDTLIKRRILHNLVDEGHLDQAITSRTEPIGNNKSRLTIELNVLKPE